MVYATTSRELYGKRQEAGHELVLMQSGSNPNKFYKVDITNGRCDCPAWKFQKDTRKPCKHLKALGFVAVSGDLAIAEPAKQNTSVGTLEYQKEI